MDVFSIEAVDIERFVALASPSFFDVIPVDSLWGRRRDLIASTRDVAGFSHLRHEVELALRRLRVPVALGPGAEPAAGRTRVDERRRGEVAMQIYFAQVGHLDRAVLDMRPARFHTLVRNDGQVIVGWNPRPLSITWDPAFIAGLRGLYAGFYRDDAALFERSASALRLSVAVDLLRRHLEGMDGTQVRFELDRLTRSFHEIFTRCQEHEVTLHPNFVALGMCLSGLYEHLAALGVPLNLRAAFDAVWERPASGRSP